MQLRVWKYVDVMQKYITLYHLAAYGGKPLENVSVEYEEK